MEILLHIAVTAATPSDHWPGARYARRSAAVWRLCAVCALPPVLSGCTAAAVGGFNSQGQDALGGEAGSVMEGEHNTSNRCGCLGTAENPN